MTTIFARNNKDELNKLSTFNIAPVSKNPPTQEGTTTTEFKQSNNKGTDLSSSNLEKGPISLIPGAKSAFSALPPEMRNNILKSGGYNEIKTSIQLGEGLNQTVDRIVNIANLSSIQQLALLVKAISGCDFPIEIVDISGLSRLGANIIMESCKIGLFDSYYAFIKCINDNVFKGNTKDKIKRNINKFLTSFVISSSTLELLFQMGKFGFASDILKYRPNIMAEFIGNYKIPMNTPQRQFKKIALDTMESYTQFKPNWFKRNSYYYITPLFKSSSDFKKVLNVGSNSVKVVETDSNNQIIINPLTGIVNKTLTDSEKVLSLSSIFKYTKNNNLFLSTNIMFKKYYPTIKI